MAVHICTKAAGNEGFCFRMLIILIVFLVLIPSTVTAISDGSVKVQVLDGEILPGQAIWYSIPGQMQGDTISVYVKGTSGNLDPFAAIKPDVINPTILREAFLSEVNQSISAGNDPLLAIPDMANRYFPAWDDDDGKGYAATFSYTVPADGTYHLMVISTPTDKTFGTYQLTVAVNSPHVLTGDEVFTGDKIAVFDAAASFANVAVQEIHGTLSPNHSSDNYALLPVKKGDRFFAYIEPASGNSIPAIVLHDYGFKRLSAGIAGEASTSTTINYIFTDDDNNNHLQVIADPRSGDAAYGNYRLLVGLNAPEVLSGHAPETGHQVIRQPVEVKTGIELDELTSIDQRNENFGIVANIWMEWNDPRLAFSPDTCDCSYKVYRNVDDFVSEQGDLWPEFTLFNQQERRWTQNQMILIRTDGTVTYFERFWVILQAPDFNFRKFPFDTQQFYIKLDSLYAEDLYIFTPWVEKTAIGSQLGEEEWYITQSDTNISSTQFTSQNSRYTFQFTMERHLMFYMLRIILPIVIIIVLSWIPFLLRDYSKRADIASANLLLFIAFNFTIANELPRLGYLTIMDSVLVTMFLVSGATVIYNLYMKWLATERAKEYADRIDRFMAWFYPLTYIIAVPAIVLFFGGN